MKSPAPREKGRKERNMHEQHKKLPDNPMAFLLRHKQIKVTPNHPEQCLGYKPGKDCACDECEHYRSCFPEE